MESGPSLHLLCVRKMVWGLLLGADSSGSLKQGATRDMSCNIRLRDPPLAEDVDCTGSESTTAACYRFYWAKHAHGSVVNMRPCSDPSLYGSHGEQGAQRLQHRVRPRQARNGCVFPPLVACGSSPLCRNFSSHRSTSHQCHHAKH